MSEHVKEQVQMSFDAILTNDKDLAEQALKLDFTTNNMYEKVRASVETVVDVDPIPNFPRFYCSAKRHTIMNALEIIQAILPNLSLMRRLP